MRWFQWPWLFLVSLFVCITQHCDTILAIYPDELFLLVGYLLSRLLQKPLFIYFHNTYLDNEPDSYFASWLQSRVFKQARHVFVMSQGMHRFYQQRYPALSCSVLSHIITEIPEVTAEFHLPPLHSPLRLLFAGNINESCSEAAGRFLQLLQTQTDLNLKIYSGMPASQLASLGFSGDRISIENVSYDLLLERLHEADIIIHPHGFSGGMKPIEYQTIFPTKTLEYLISLRPILAHAPEDCFISEFYRKYDCALLVHEPTVEALEKGLFQLRSDELLRRRLVKNALGASEQFRGKYVVQSLKDKIAECQNNRPRSG